MATMLESIVSFVFGAVITVVLCAFAVTLGWEIIKGFLDWD